MYCRSQNMIEQENMSFAKNNLMNNCSMIFKKKLID